ncbi:MAG: AI-2E family transporter [Sphingomonadales bacterium]
MNILNEWIEKLFADPQVVYLLFVLLLALLTIMLFGKMVTPVIASVVIAFLLDGGVERLNKRGLSSFLSVVIVYIVFMTLAVFAFFTILPPIMSQFAQFFGLLPAMAGALQDAAMKLPEAYPGLIDESQILDLITKVRAELLIIGQRALTFSLGNITNLLTIIVYMILVPVMLFFFLKDKAVILHWLSGFLPNDRTLLDQVWKEVMTKTGDYARGKVYEILIVGFSSWVVYTFLDLRFAAFLALLTGFSVVIPYIGAALVTFPVGFVALFQWGFGAEFLGALIAYLIMQAIDGNLLAPLLFSEVVKLHPNAIILAILIFGGIWGLWGVFFAIPLATLSHAVIKAWSSRRKQYFATIK